MTPLCHARCLPRQKTSGTSLSGIQEASMDSRQAIAGMTIELGCRARSLNSPLFGFIWGHVPITSGFRYMSPGLCGYANVSTLPQDEATSSP